MKSNSNTESNQKSNQDYIKQIGFNQIIGLEKAKERLRTRLVDYYTYKKEMLEKGFLPSQGMILYGIPGVGKTTLVEAAIKELCDNNPNLIVKRIEPHHLISGQMGKASKLVSELFNQARQENFVTGRDTILIMDEIDAIVPHRGKTNSVMTKERISQFLQEIGGMFNIGCIYIIGTTNRPWDVEPAFFRSGRLEDTMHIPPPNKKERELLWNMYTKYIKLYDGIKTEIIVAWTNGYSGADFKTIGRDLLEISLKRKNLGIDTIIMPMDIVKTFQKCSINNGNKIMKMAKFESAYNRFIQGENVDFNNLEDMELDETIDQDLISKLTGKDINN